MSSKPQLLKRWNNLKALHHTYKEMLQDESKEFLFFQPNEDKWSAAQVINHLTKVDKNTYDFITQFDFNRKKEKMGLRNKLNSLMLNYFLKSSLKAKVPVESIYPEEKPDIESMISFYDDFTSKFEKFIEQFPEDKLDFFIFKHPLAGKLNILQTVEFLTNHSRHHSIQINKLKRKFNQLQNGRST
ncbi:DinB family protein [Mangrovivirga cuniculi]|uniref:DinB-like domain-containing protein n=1 Tax=Mangrovivirga cuniculi TaxID=2715131 RepID=A0A4D7JXX2_9BACT|nr:DinB family protein [Mangrovivirga cuniculi]QCK15545.1 hypothetical protein DCC35_12705 [Mangrovivirga cuniculi]